MNDQQPPNTLRRPARRRLGLAVTAVVLGLLSFVVGLRLFTPSKPDGSADGSRPLPSSKPDAPASGTGPRPSSTLDIPALRSQMFAVTKAITAKDGNGPAAKKVEQP